MKPHILFTFFVASLGIVRAQDAAPSPSSATAEGRVAFRVRAPKANEVLLRGQWTKEPIPLVRGEKDDWSVTVEKIPAGVWEYSFGVDGMNVLDALNPAFKPQREPQKSIVHIPSTPPAAWDWQDVPHGTVHGHSYASKALGRPREVLVYTPAGYERDTAKTFPLLVLQHGSGDNYRTWVAHGKAHWILDNLIAQGKARPMIVLMLDGHPLGMMSRETPPEKRGDAMNAFQRELFEDALPLVESLYRVEKDPAQRGIAGLSMGGAQSLTIGLGNLGRFGWIGAFSAGPPSREVTEKFLADPAAANANLRLLWIAVGKDDFLRQRNEEFVTALKEKGVKHEWQLTDGDHSWPVWRRYLAEFAPRLFSDAK
jgi:enterochelin esterase family protein